MEYFPNVKISHTMQSHQQFKLHGLRFNGQWVPINPSEMISISLEKLSTDLVNKIEELSKDTSNIFGEPIEFTSDNKGSDRMYLCIFDAGFVRRGRLYYALQYSYETGKLRLVVYGYDQIYHSAISFGSTYNSFNFEDLKKMSMEALESKKGQGLLPLEMVKLLENGLIFGF